jgi:putative ABC transport system permease protein
MILLVPVVLAAMARLGRRLPLVARYAVRDAARHRTRTVPAVAAVAATVTGVVALGIANASDAAQNEATYEPQLAHGMGFLSVPQEDVDWSRFEEAIQREQPQVGNTEMRAYDPYTSGTYVDLRLRQPGSKEWNSFLDSYQGPFGQVLVGASALDLVVPVDEDDLEGARSMLDGGGVVVLTSRPVDGDTVRVSGAIHSSDGQKKEKLTPVELPAYFLQLQGSGPALAVAAEGALDDVGLSATTSGLLLDAHDLSKEQEESLSEVVQGMDVNAYLYVERGFQNDNETLILLGILFGLGAVLMLGGTLTATFLALSDARPDLATLAAVGAAPRARRGVAAAYALVVGFAGALMGAAVGFIPGIAVTYPLTSTSWMPAGVDAQGDDLPSHFVDIPWLMIAGLVLVLPVVTAVIVGLTARSRLPLVARLD